MKIKADKLPLQIIKICLIEDHRDLDPISDWSIRLILKSKLMYSYKKMCSMPTSRLNSDNFWENTCILNWIDESSYKIWSQVPFFEIPNFVNTSQKVSVMDIDAQVA